MFLAAPHRSVQLTPPLPPHKPHLKIPPSVQQPAENRFVTGAKAPTPDNAICGMRNIEFEGEQNLGSDKRLPKSVFTKERKNGR